MPDPVGPEFPEGSDFQGFTEEELTSVVFDDEFIAGARYKEPPAGERGLTDAVDRTPTPVDPGGGEDAPEPEPPPRGPIGHPYLEDPWRVGLPPGWDPPATPGPDGAAGPGWFFGFQGDGKRTGRRRGWHRFVAWVLAVLMGVGVVAMAVSAVYRGNSDGGPSPSPPPTSVSTTPPPAATTTAGAGLTSTVPAPF